MEFRISDSFTSSLAKLTSDEQKAVKTTAFDLQMNPENPGFSFHKLDRAQDKNFWSVRVNRDIRVIVHRSKSSLLLCYVAHHDDAYKWAERRKLETHPKTGAAQLVEIRERVEEVRVPVYVTVEAEQPPKPLLFNKFDDDALLGFGVPSEWLTDVKNANEDSILELADHLPAEASEALIEIAVGGTPKPSVTVSPEANPFEHPDAQRRFRIMTNQDELERALDFPWEKWTVFLHPDQQELVEKDFNGPARVSGSAGTGKTIVALHRAAHLARQNTESRVLLTTFTDSLANALKEKLKHLIGNTPRLAERLEIHSMDAIALRLHKFNAEKKRLLNRDQLFEIVSKYANDVKDLRYSKAFVFEEWSQMVDAWQLTTWDEYKDVRRLGRKTRLTEAQRQILWSIYEKVNAELQSTNSVSMAGIYLDLTQSLSVNNNSPFDFVVVDEAQDISIPQLRFLAALGGDRPNALFFAGDLGQRIFQQAFSWKSLGVDIRGRSKTLRVNYRTSHQIRMQADRLLGPKVADVDGNEDDRSETVSVFNGPQPQIQNFDSSDEEISFVADWINSLVDEGYEPHEIGIIVRSDKEVERAIAVVEKISIPYKLLDSYIQLAHGYSAICTMHLAKGLEFRAVVVMACDDEIIPSQERIESVADNSDLEEVYETERHLLYVACTRARDRLLVTSGEMPSEFLEDMGSAGACS
jgi:mRNA-degrading endonuclease RelE of RelBE toxin-antitoxin system|tara:strand:- start:4843 stop:6930 length:2088 start_codon:yes stop_codon:yes gene_type:complete